MTRTAAARRPPRGYEALAMDGGVVRLRPVGKDDGPALHEMCDRSSDRSLYLRFFSANRRVADGYLTSLASDSDDDRYSLVVESAGRVVAVAGWERLGPDTAEVALLVEDEQQGRGLGTLLVEELAEHARGVGITGFVADSLVENRQMFEVFTRSGLRGRPVTDAGVLHWELATDLDEKAMALVDDREAAAETASLAPLLAPRAVVVMGGGPRTSGAGEAVLRNLVAGGYAGSLHVVASGELEVAGLLASAHLADLPVRPDLAVIAVRPDRVLDALDECGRAGVRAAVVLSTATADARELVTTARSHGIRLVGPDSLGVVSTDPDVRLAAWAGGRMPEPGRLALVTQSGAVGVAIADHARRSGLGLAALVSLGEKVDVSGNDLLLEWWHDPRVSAIALYLESLGNPRKLARLARRVGAAKPVLVVAAGRSRDPAGDALFTQAGVLRTRTVEELVDVARLLDSQPLPDGGRLVVVGNGGGIGVLAADAARSAGLEMSPLPGRLRAQLGQQGEQPVDNPVDLGGAVTPGRLAEVLGLVAGSGEADVVLVAVAVTGVADLDALLAAVSHADLGDLTVVVVVVGADDPPTHVPLGRGGAAPVYAFPEPAVAAVGHVVRYGRWRRTGPGSVTEPPGVRRPDARALVQRSLRTHHHGCVATETLTAQLLACYGIETAPDGRVPADGVGLVVSVRRADTFGSLVSVRLAGLLPELLGDTSARLAPLTDRDAAEMLLGLSGAPLLRGHGGADPVDLAAVADLLAQVSALADDLPEVAALVLDPVVARRTGLVVGAARLSIEPPAGVPHPRRRALR